MKTLGIIGGMSWEATDLYYQGINRGIYEQRGGLYSADIIMKSVNFQDIEPLMARGEWDTLGTIMADHASCLQTAGADGIVLTTNTVHKVASAIEKAITIPFLHIVDTTAAQLNTTKTIGLIGTQYTMSDGFYHDRMTQSDIQVITPDDDAQTHIDRIIFQELCQGQVTPHANALLKMEANKLIDAGAETIVLGCTELIISFATMADLNVPIIDSTQCHIDAAITFLLEKE